MSILIQSQLTKAKLENQKKFSILVDPDKFRLKNIDQILNLANNCAVDYFFIGGSLVVDHMLEECLNEIRKNCDIPLVLFPGSTFQISKKADAILFLSLISGRNPDLLIGQQVIAAPYIKAADLEVLATGYVLVDGGKPTTVQYISNTMPIPHDKVEIAVCTAMAGEMLGLSQIYMDAGSGAMNPISSSMIRAVSSRINIPLIVGGGITTPEKALENAQAGAEVIVIGNAIEKDPLLIAEIADAIKSAEKNN